MESPPILMGKGTEAQRRMSSTSQLFTRIQKITSSRQLKTSKFPRSINLRNQSLQNSKQNISYQNYIQKVRSAIKVDQKQMASKCLLSLRKQFDKMSKFIQQQSKGINIMKKQIKFMKGRVRNERQSWFSAKQKLQQLTKELYAIDMKQQQAKMDSKTLNHIIERMKQDQLSRKYFFLKEQQELKLKKKRVKHIQDEILLWDDTVHKYHQTVEHLKSEYEKNNYEREFKWLDYQNYMSDLQDQEKFELERKQRTFQLLSMEANDILDAKNIVLRDVLLTHKLFDKLLEGKINDLLNQYQGLQNCYHLIKTETNISDPQLLAKKFFSYAETLEQITSAVRFYEQKQDGLMERNKSLKQIQRQKMVKRLEQERIVLENQKQAEQEKQKVIEQYLDIEVSIKKIRIWIDKISESCSGFEINRTWGLKKNNLDIQSISDLIEHICNIALRKSEEVSKQQINQKFQSPGIRLKKLIKQFSMEEQKNRRSQAQEVNESNLLENAYICYERKQVKKNQKNHFLIKLQQNKMISKQA